MYYLMCSCLLYYNEKEQEVGIVFVNPYSFVCQVVCIVNSLSSYTSSMQCKT